MQKKRYDEINEEIHNPNNVHPINAAVHPCLQHFADASQHARHAQSEND